MNLRLKLVLLLGVVGCATEKPATKEDIEKVLAGEGLTPETAAVIAPIIEKQLDNAGALASTTATSTSSSSSTLVATSTSTSSSDKVEMTLTTQEKSVILRELGKPENYRAREELLKFCGEKEREKKVKEKHKDLDEKIVKEIGDELRTLCPVVITKETETEAAPTAMKSRSFKSLPEAVGPATLGLPANTIPGSTQTVADSFGNIYVAVHYDQGGDPAVSGSKVTAASAVAVSKDNGVTWKLLDELTTIVQADPTTMSNPQPSDPYRVKPDVVCTTVVEAPYGKDYFKFGITQPSRVSSSVTSRVVLAHTNDGNVTVYRRMDKTVGKAEISCPSEVIKDGVTLVAPVKRDPVLREKTEKLLLEADEEMLAKISDPAAREAEAKRRALARSDKLNPLDKWVPFEMPTPKIKIAVEKEYSLDRFVLKGDALVSRTTLGSDPYEPIELVSVSGDYAIFSKQKRNFTTQYQYGSYATCEQTPKPTYAKVEPTLVAECESIWPTDEQSAFFRRERNVVDGDTSSPSQELGKIGYSTDGGRTILWKNASAWHQTSVTLNSNLITRTGVLTQSQADTAKSFKTFAISVYVKGASNNIHGTLPKVPELAFSEDGKAYSVESASIKTYPYYAWSLHQVTLDPTQGKLNKEKLFEIPAVNGVGAPELRFDAKGNLHLAHTDYYDRTVGRTVSYRFYPARLFGKQTGATPNITARIIATTSCVNVCTKLEHQLRTYGINFQKVSYENLDETKKADFDSEMNSGATGVLVLDRGGDDPATVALTKQGYDELYLAQLMQQEILLKFVDSSEGSEDAATDVRLNVGPSLRPTITIATKSSIAAYNYVAYQNEKVDNKVTRVGRNWLKEYSQKQAEPVETLRTLIPVPPPRPYTACLSCAVMLSQSPHSRFPEYGVSGVLRLKRNNDIGDTGTMQGGFENADSAMKLMGYLSFVFGDKDAALFRRFINLNNLGFDKFNPDKELVSSFINNNFAALEKIEDLGAFGEAVSDVIGGGVTIALGMYQAEAVFDYTISQGEREKALGETFKSIGEGTFSVMKGSITLIELASERPNSKVAQGLLKWSAGTGTKAVSLIERACVVRDFLENALLFTTGATSVYNGAILLVEAANANGDFGVMADKMTDGMFEFVGGGFTIAEAFNYKAAGIVRNSIDIAKWIKSKNGFADNPLVSHIRSNIWFVGDKAQMEAALRASLQDNVDSAWHQWRSAWLKGHRKLPSELIVQLKTGFELAKTSPDSAPPMYSAFLGQLSNPQNKNQSMYVSMWRLAFGNASPY